MKCSADIVWLFERPYMSGILSKYSGFTLNVSGTIGLKEINNLIRKLEQDRELYKC